MVYLRMKESYVPISVMPHYPSTSYCGAGVYDPLRGTHKLQGGDINIGASPIIKPEGGGLLGI